MLKCYTKKCFTGIIFIMLLWATTGYAAIQDTTARAGKQPAMVTGMVVDENNRPLNGVTIQVKDKTTIAITDPSGRFGLVGDAGDVLEFSYPNHYVSDVTLNSNTDSLHVRMLDRFLQTRDKVDVLYGTTNTESMLGSVSTIYTNQVTTTPASLYVYALPGQLAGLYTQQGSGFTSANNSNPLSQGIFSSPIIVTAHGNVPTDNTEIGITVRGQSVTTIIDGIQQNISSIDPESIESISILKDALSTILLGINSSKPILLVTTKKAEIGPPRITFTSEAGIQQSLGLPQDQLSAYQWAYLFNEATENDGGNAVYTTADLAAYKNHTDPYGHPDVNWQKLLLDNYSPLLSDKLNVSGGTETARYTVALDYLDQGGIFKESPSIDYSTNNNLSRYSLNSNVSINVTKNLSVDLQLYGRVEQINEPGAGYSPILSGILNTPNNAYPVYNPDGSFGASNVGNAFNNNLLSMAQYSGYILTKVHDVLANLDLTYKLDGVTKGLSFKGKANTAIESQVEIDRSFRNNAFGYVLGADSTVRYNSEGQASSISNAFSSTLSARYSFEQASFDYARQFGKSSISAQAFYDTRSLALSYDLTAVSNNRAIQGAYNYDGKYFIEGIANYSGYNRYPPGHQNGLFYAGGLGWQMGKENFIKDAIDWINSWKWRASFGQTGNNNVGYYTYEETYNSGANSYPTGISRSTGLGNGYAENTPIADPNVTWEKAHKFDFGTDISLLQNHLQITADYYHEEYYDLLAVRGASIALLGTSYPSENIATNLYTGGEFEATYQNHLDNFNYFITGNAAISASKRVYFDEEPQKYPWNAHTGLPVSAIFGYKAIGFYTVQDVQNKAASIAGYTPKPGDIKYADLNGDGVIDQYDQTAIGGLKPLVFYGTTLGFNYKGLSFSVIFEGVFNRQINISNNVTNGLQGVNAFIFLPLPPAGQGYQNILNRWTPETAATATYPRLSIDNTNTILQTSTFFLKNGDYVRLKNAEIGYTLPASLSAKLRLSAIRVFVDGENLYTIAGYKGFAGMDPEVNQPGAYPIQRVINAGLTIKL